MQLPHGKTIDLPWNLPVPSTSFVSGPNLVQGRTSTLSWVYEGDSEFVTARQEGMIRSELRFEGVIASRCTYGDLCGADIINVAYNKLINLGQTAWLAGLKQHASCGHHLISVDSLRHVGIFFDDGPFYEFVCEHILISETLAPMA